MVSLQLISPVPRLLKVKAIPNQKIALGAPKRGREGRKLTINESKV
jgi:hypothetical protein